MQETEGVIQFRLEFTPAPPVEAALVAELDHWRDILRRLGGIGQDPARYGGIGFGNLSRRVPGTGEFVITGSQTGGRPELTPADYTVVTATDPAANRVRARGPIAPSSEAMTHAVLYAADDGVHYVFHVHLPALWQAAERLGLAATSVEAGYGTPAMAAEVARLLADPVVRRRGLIVMRGHRDGVIAFGATAATAGEAIERALAAAPGG